MPIKAPITVPTESAKRALSSFDLKPELVCILRISSSLKIPERRPVPIKVPNVSKVSLREKAKMVMRTRGMRPGSEKRPRSPSFPRATPNTVDRSWKEPATEGPSDRADRSTTPMGMPIIVVAKILIKMAPFTFLITRTTVINRPIIARSTPALSKLTRAGTAAEEPIMVPPSRA